MTKIPRVVYTTVAKLPLDSVHTTVVILSHNEAEKQYDKKTTYCCKNATITMYADNMLTDDLYTKSMLTDNMLTDNMLADNMLADNMLADNMLAES